MKSAAFIQMMARYLTTSPNTVTDYARRLKEAGLLSTGARGVNAPEMTPLDAARLLLALLTTSSAAQCVERVKRFGQIEYKSHPQQGRLPWKEFTSPSDVLPGLEGKNLEEAIAFLIGVPAEIGISKAAAWFIENNFSLDVFDFEVKAELNFWVSEGGKVIKEKILKFSGPTRVVVDGELKPVEGFEFIPGGIRCVRSVASSTLLNIGAEIAGEGMPD